MTRTPQRTPLVYQVYIKALRSRSGTPSPRPSGRALWLRRSGRLSTLSPGGAYKAFASPQMKAYGTPDYVDGEVVEVTRRAGSSRPGTRSGTRTTAPNRRCGRRRDRAGWRDQAATRLIDRTEGAPRVDAMITGSIEGAGGGWPYVLSDIKSLLETGSALDGLMRRVRSALRRPSALGRPASTTSLDAGPVERIEQRLHAFRELELHLVRVQRQEGEEAHLPASSSTTSASSGQSPARCYHRAAQLHPGPYGSGDRRSGPCGRLSQVVRAGAGRAA